MYAVTYHHLNDGAQCTWVDAGKHDLGDVWKCSHPHRTPVNHLTLVHHSHLNEALEKKHTIVSYNCPFVITKRASST